MEKNIERATLGGGCFWCVETIYKRLKGVEKVRSGYSGGSIKNPAYREVCEGRTGHAEVCEIKFDPEIISFQEILDVFWKMHDPTTLNRQGNDVGTQYRSVIFFHTNTQKILAETSKLSEFSSVKFKDSKDLHFFKSDKFVAPDIGIDKYFSFLHLNNPLTSKSSILVIPFKTRFSNSGRLPKKFILLSFSELDEP